MNNQSINIVSRISEAQEGITLVSCHGNDHSERRNVPPSGYSASIQAVYLTEAHLSSRNARL